MISENTNTEYLTLTMEIMIIEMLQKFVKITSNSEQTENKKNAGNKKTSFSKQ